MPGIYVGDEELTRMDQIQTGTENQAVFAGDELIFPTVTDIILMGTVTDNITNATVSPLSYSVTGSAGDEVVVNFTITPNTGFEYTNEMLPAVSLLANGVSNVTQTNGIATIAVTFTIPDADTTDDFNIQGEPASELEDWDCNDFNGSVSVASNGVITVTGGDNVDSNVQVNTANFGNNNGCSGIARTVSFTVTVNSANFANNGQQVPCSRTVTQSGTGANFDRNDWTGSLNVDSAGNVSVASTGNVTSVDILSEDCNDGRSSCNSSSCSALVLLTGIPTTFCNGGTTRSITATVNLVRPAGLAGWGQGNWTGGVSISQSGVISVNQGNSPSVTLNTGNFTANNGCNDIRRQVSVTVQIPSGQCNSGNLNFNLGVDQPPGNRAFRCGDERGNVSVASNGVISVNLTNVNNVDVLTDNFTGNAGCSTVARLVQYSFTVPATNPCNPGALLVCSQTVQQPGTGVNFTFNDWTGSLNVSNNGDVSVASNGNATSVTIIRDGCGAAQECSDVNCQALTSIGVPTTGGWCNAGGTITVQVPLTIPQTGTNTSCANAGNGGFSVSAAGAASNPTSSRGTVSNINFVGATGSSYPTVTTATVRTVTFQVTVSSGCNAGSVLNCSLTATQPAMVDCTNFRLDFTGGFGVQGVYRGTMCGGTTNTFTIFADTTLCFSDTPVALQNVTITNLGSSCT